MHFRVDFTDTPFLSTSEVGVDCNRLNWRCELLLSRNEELVRDKRVLDIASHDGRFSYACLKLGARSVTGVEARASLQDRARSNLASLGIDGRRHEFVVGDIFDWLPRFEPGQFDTILCFGFLYHTIRQVEFFSAVAALRPEALILDSTVSLNRGQPFVEAIRLLKRIRPRHLLRAERASLIQSLREGREALFFSSDKSIPEGATIDASRWRAHPTCDLLVSLLRYHGFESTVLEWGRAGIRDWQGIGDYKARARISLVGRRRVASTPP